jgi:hypothetical protein
MSGGSKFFRFLEVFENVILVFLKYVLIGNLLKIIFYQYIKIFENIKKFNLKQNFF